jgi:hypothetical protein
VLREFKDTHNDVKRVGQNEHRDKGFEYPLPYFVGLKIVHIVLVDYHRDKLIAQHESQYNARYGDNHRLGQRAYKVEHVCVPSLRRLSYVGGDFADFGVHFVEHARKVGDNAVRQDLPEPIGDCVRYPVHPLSTPLAELPLLIIVTLRSFKETQAASGFCRLPPVPLLRREPFLCAVKIQRDFQK